MSASEQLEIFWWTLYALALGAAVGFEREFRGHEAGIRTTAIVCAGAALFGHVSLSLGESRVAAGVVQGIGFLGAGLVFQRGNSVKGVTTAATIWVMAAVGLVVAEKLWLLALLTCVSIIVVLELAPVSDRLLRRSRAAGRTHPEAVSGIAMTHGDTAQDDHGARERRERQP